MIEVKTAELIGPALDWCVCMVATGAQYHDDYGRATLVIPGAAAMMDGLKRPGYIASVPDYSSDWAQGGPLRDRYRVSVDELAFDQGVRAKCWYDGDGHQVIGLPSAVGDTALVAICRAIVAAMLGDVVQVPAELVGVAA